MSFLVITVFALGLAAAIGALVVNGKKASMLRAEVAQLKLAAETMRGERRVLVGKIDAMQEVERKLIGQLDNADQEITHYREQLELRPMSKRKTYRILTLGAEGTGKTSLTLKWANPLADPTSMPAAKIQRYERCVSRVPSAREITEHVFEVHDWGGEHIVDAVQELITEEIHGLLLVVDLGGKGAIRVDQERIKAQLQAFQPEALRYLFFPRMMASCKTVVLFINKSDLIPATPSQIEEQAKQLYRPLIDSLAKYAHQIDVEVFVGSATCGHAMNSLFSHFIDKILPKNAYDKQLLQGTKMDIQDQPSVPPITFLDAENPAPTGSTSHGTAELLA